jgi:hypothetical protein
MKTLRLRTQAIILAIASIGSITAIAIPTGYAHESGSGIPAHQSGNKPREHQHSNLEIPPGQPVPTVSLMVHPDPMKGWNLEVKVTNFRFAPDRMNAKSSATEGHAHLYVNGKKVTRLYGSWYYLDSLPPGQNKITVSLNANGHEQLTYRNKPIEASATIQVPASSKP